MHPPPFLCPKENPLEMPKEKTRPMDYIYIYVCTHMRIYAGRPTFYDRSPLIAAADSPILPNG